MISSHGQRNESMAVLGVLRMKGFIGGIIWRLRVCLGTKEYYLLCPANEKHGEFLLSEIMTAGDLGQYNQTMKRKAKASR